MAFEEFTSRELGTEVRCGYVAEWDRQDDGSPYLELQLDEIWVGAWECSAHIDQRARAAVYDELHALLHKARRRGLVDARSLRRAPSLVEYL